MKQNPSNSDYNGNKTYVKSTDVTVTIRKELITFLKSVRETTYIIVKTIFLLKVTEDRTKILNKYKLPQNL